MSQALRDAVFEAMTNAQDNGYEKEMMEDQVDEVVTDLCDHDAVIEKMKSEAIDEAEFLAAVGRHVEEWRKAQKEILGW